MAPVGVETRIKIKARRKVGALGGKGGTLCLGAGTSIAWRWEAVGHHQGCHVAASTPSMGGGSKEEHIPTPPWGVCGRSTVGCFHPLPFEGGGPCTSIGGTLPSQMPALQSKCKVPTHGSFSGPVQTKTPAETKWCQSHPPILSAHRHPKKTHTSLQPHDPPACHQAAQFCSAFKCNS